MVSWFALLGQAYFMFKMSCCLTVRLKIYYPTFLTFSAKIVKKEERRNSAADDGDGKIFISF